MLYHKCKCGRLIPQELRRCPECEKKENESESRHVEYNRHRRNKKTAAFYTSGEWRKVRALTLSTYDGIDMYAYYVQHTIEPAEMVHHIVEIEDDWSRRLDITNLFPLSNKNHGIISALYRRDAATKRRTQEQLREILRRHWEEAGGAEKSFGRPGLVATTLFCGENSPRKFQKTDADEKTVKIVSDSDTGKRRKGGR